MFTDVYLLDKPSALRRHTIEELKSQSLLHGDTLDKDQRREGGVLAAEHKRLFILGQPGAGKTTFLKHLAIQAVQNQIDAIPIFVSLKDWSDTQRDLMDFLVRQFAICSFPNARPFIETILETGQAMVLFDGLDEVSAAEGQQQRITQAIRQFAQQYAQSRIVITCRTAATEFTFTGFTYCEVADFTQAEIEAFVGRWFAHNATKREAFLVDFALPENERLRDLARRPLLLTILCLTFDETMSFPQRRAELYAEAIDALLKKWDNSRSIQRDQIYRNLSLGYKRQLLAELAAETFERSEFFVPKAYLVERIVRFIRRMPQADQNEEIDGESILRSIEAQHGLLIERARGVYGFVHLIFHEYLTAYYIVSHQSDQNLRSAIAQAINPQWREVLLLTASMLDYNRAVLFFQIWSQRLQMQLYETPPLAEMIRWAGEQAAGADLGIRAAIVTITMIDQAIIFNRLPINTNASSRIRTLAHARTSANTQAFDLNLASTSTNTLDLAASTSASVSARISARFTHQTTENQHPTLDTLPEQDWNLDKNQLEALGRYLSDTQMLLDCLDLAAIEDRQAVLDQLLVPPG